MSRGWTLAYDNGLTLSLPPEEMEAFSSASFYKLSLRRYFSGGVEGTLFGKPSLTYLDFKRIISLCTRESEKRQIPLLVTNFLQQYISSRENLLEQRSRLGLEIIHREPKLDGLFQAYRSVVDAAMVRPLRERQMWDSFFMCSMHRCANFSVPGSGKTASVLGVYAFLKHQGLARRIVVVCPKNAFGSWMDEFVLTFGAKEPLHVLNLHAPSCSDTAARRVALRYDAGNSNLILVNYELAGSVLEDLIPLVQADSLLVFDEVHKVKRVGGDYAGSALRLAQAARALIALTGTPIPNSYLDLYNLLHILFPDEYNEVFGFQPQVLRAPTAADIASINQKIQPFFCRTTKHHLGVPPANPDRLFSYSASPEENRLFQLLKIKYRRNRLPLFLRTLQLESDPRMLMQRLNLQDFQYLLDDTKPIEEIDFADYSDEVRQLIESCPPSTKFRHCIQQTQTLVSQGKPVILWCIFVESIQKLSAELERLGIHTQCIYGAVPLEERQYILNEFRSGHIQVLLTNPHTLAESVSLHSVCHDAIYYEYSYNLVHLLQSKDRIHRLGLPPGQYTQYTFLQLEYETENGPWSMDMEVYQRLKEKEQTMLDAIENRTLETLPTSREDLDAIFKPLFKHQAAD